LGDPLLEVHMVLKVCRGLRTQPRIRTCPRWSLPLLPRVYSTDLNSKRYVTKRVVFVRVSLREFYLRGTTEVVFILDTVFRALLFETSFHCSEVGRHKVPILEARRSPPSLTGTTANDGLNKNPGRRSYCCLLLHLGEISSDRRS
jgi:hypothetical protein